MLVGTIGLGLLITRVANGNLLFDGTLIMLAKTISRTSRQGLLESVYLFLLESFLLYVMVNSA